jgi:hypothetical protein
MLAAARLQPLQIDQPTGEVLASASLGALALVGFAITTWMMLPRASTALALSSALLVWSALSGLLWWLSRYRAALRRWLIRRR